MAMRSEKACFGKNARQEHKADCFSVSSVHSVAKFLRGKKSSLLTCEFTQKQFIALYAN